MSAKRFESSSPTLRPRPSFGLRLAQVVWLILVLLAISRFAFSVFVYYQGGAQVCAAAAGDCHAGQMLTAQDLASIQADGISPTQWVVYNIVYRVLFTLVFTVVGLLIILYKRDDGAALLVSLFLMLFGTLGGFNGYVVARYPDYAVLLNLAQYLSVVAMPVFFFSFPNGRVVPRAMWGFIIAWSLFFLIDTLFPMLNKTSAAFRVISEIAWLTLWIGGAGSQLYRYLRVSNEVERRQIKWVVSGLVGLVLFLLFMLMVPPFSEWSSEQGQYSFPGLVLNTALNLMLTVIPITIGIAIFRYRLYEIDVIIRRTLIYGILTGLLALFYFGAVITLQQLFRGLTGQGDDLAIILSTLAAATLFIPLRNWVQRAIDRRFYRSKYNAARVLEAFGATVRDEVDLKRLTDRLVAVVEETVQPEYASVWLKTTEDGRRGTRP